MKEITLEELLSICSMLPKVESVEDGLVRSMGDNPKEVTIGNIESSITFRIKRDGEHPRLLEWEPTVQLLITTSL